MGAVEDIELDGLIADAAWRKDLVAEFAVAHGEAVNARDLHHVAFLLVADSHVFHLEILGVRRLQDRVLARVAVEGAADQGDVFVCVAGDAASGGIVVAGAEHVAVELALQGNSREVESGVAVDEQAPVQIIAARRDLDGHGIAVGRGALRVVKSVLHRSRKAVAADIRRSDLYGLRGDLLAFGLRGKGGNGGGACQQERRKSRSRDFLHNFVHFIHLFA